MNLRRKSGKKRIRRGSRRPYHSQSRNVIVASVTFASVLFAVGFLFYNNNLAPTTPTEVFVIIAKGAGENLHLGFEPANITVVIGVNNTVMWKNEDSDWHTAHSNIPEFNSGLIQPGDNFTHTFLRAGVYPYHCDPHPWMTGVVVVKSATSTGTIMYLLYSLTSQAEITIITSIKYEMFSVISFVFLFRMRVMISRLVTRVSRIKFSYRTCLSL